MSNLKVLVVGASIAGPTAAYWLAKAGASVTVIERFPELRKGGQNVDIRTAGVTVMRRMKGMTEAVESKVPKWDGMQLVTTDGKPVFTITTTGDPENQSLMSEYEIFRGDLAKVIHDLSMETGRVKYVFGEQISAIQQNEKASGPIKIEFTNNLLPSSEYDLVVACDGATSRTRALGLSCGVRDHIHPINAWAAFFSTKTDLLKGSNMCQAHSAIGGRWFGIAQYPAGGNRIVMMGIHPKGEKDATLPFREAQKKGDAALKQYVSEFFKNAGWKTDEVLAALETSDDFYASETVQVKVPSIRKGRFVLVGDAGYATGPTGQGTSLAMTGAYVLAGEISKHEGNLESGLKAYEERMKPIIKDMQTIPPGIPQMLAPQTAWGIWFRNFLFAFFAGAMSYGKYFSWLGGVFGTVGTLFGSAFGGDKHRLEEYEFKF